MIRFTHEGRYVESSGDGREGPASPNGLSGHRFHDLLFREAGARGPRRDGRALDTGDLQAFDFSLDLPGGTRQFEARIAPSGADEVTAIVRDFTTQRTAEAELRRSRARIVEAADAERRRLERDLHDGAQQRLVSLSLALRLLRARLGGDGGADPEAVAAADEAAAQVKIAIRELRELARGIHPAILTEAGLGPAIRRSRSARRSRPRSGRSRIADCPRRRGNRLLRGIGGAGERREVRCRDHGERRRGLRLGHVAGRGRRRRHRRRGPEPGDGHPGPADRVAALGGRLTVHSPPGQGTRITAEIPIG